MTLLNISEKGLEKPTVSQRYTQPTVKVEELRMPGLDGMLPGANVKAREKKVLEYLIAAEKVVRRDYPNKYYKEFIGQLYPTIYDRVKNDLLRDVEYDEDDLSDYILARSGHNNISDIVDYSLALYTGCLLDLLTERYEAAGKPTTFYFDGRGKEFNYLFMGAQKVDGLIVNNFTGYDLCTSIGTNGGYANNVMLVNCSGGRHGSTMGVDKGNLGVVTVINHHSDGDYALIGSAAVRSGNAGMLILSGCKGKSGLSGIARDDGKIGLVLMTHCEFKRASPCMASDGGNIGLFILDEVKTGSVGKSNHGTSDFFKYKKIPHVKRIFLSNPPGEISTICDVEEELVFKPESPERWDEVVQEYNIAQLIKQLTSITKDSTKEEIMEVASQIRAIYELNKPKLDKLLEK